jgi:hypothetical protein
MAMIAVTSTSAPHLNVDFDREEGVLYVSLGSPQPSYIEEVDDGVLLRRANTDNHPSGVTAIDFQANWRGRRRNFYSLVAQHLDIAPSIVEREIERIF